MKRATVKAVLAGLSVSAALAGSSAAYAAPVTRDGKAAGATEATPFGYVAPDILRKMRSQDGAKAAATLIRKAVDSGGATGFSGVALEGNSVVLWFKGAPPAAVTAAIGKAKGRAPVEVRPARYSYAELQAASESLVRYLRAHPEGPAHSVAIPGDGHALIVGTEQTLSAQAVGLPDVGVAVETEHRARIKPLSRIHDWAPFFGGARIRNDDNAAACTIGFAMQDQWDYSKRYVVTAGHCGRPGGTWTNGDYSHPVGRAVLENVYHDVLLIEASGASRIYDGGVGSGEFIKAVTSWDYAHAGEWVCTSGSYTGALCNHVTLNAVYTMCTWDAYNNYECYGDLVGSYQYDGLTAGQGGDSGGPVFGLSGSTVVGKGTITGGSGNQLYWQDLFTTWVDFGVVPLTG